MLLLLGCPYTLPPELLQIINTTSSACCPRSHFLIHKVGRLDSGQPTHACGYMEGGGGSYELTLVGSPSRPYGLLKAGDFHK